jgi:hypothetical protein
MLFIIWIYRFNQKNNSGYYEGFNNGNNNTTSTSNKPYIIKYNYDIYDDFYMKMYDKLYTPSTNAKIVSASVKKYKKTTKDSIVLITITGNVATILQKTYNTIYILNNSTSNLQYIASKYKNLQSNILCNDITSYSSINNNSISLLYFDENMMYLYDKATRQIILENISNWLLPDGLLLVHLTVPASMNALIPASKKYIDFQKFSKEKILESEINIGDYTYQNKHIINKDNTIQINEKFINKKAQNIREYKQTLYIPSIREFIDELHNAFYTTKEIITIEENAKYIYVFRKK